MILIAAQHAQIFNVFYERDTHQARLDLSFGPQKAKIFSSKSATYIVNYTYIVWVLKDLTVGSTIRL